MIRFDADVHTPEALSCELRAFEIAHKGGLVIGSLGRAGLYSDVFGNPLHEFEARGEDPLGNAVKARDIDVIGVGDERQADFGPFELDNTCFADNQAFLVHDGGNWFLEGKRQKFSEPIHPDVMEPQEVETVFGIPCITVRPQTHLALYGLKGFLRAKDIETAKVLVALSEEDPYPLPDELYEPFDRLRDMNMSSFYTKLRKVYQRCVSEDTRMALYPLVKRLKQLIP